MDPWIEDNEEHAKDLVERLVSNDPSFTAATIDSVISDEEWRVVTEALKRNTTLENLEVRSCADDEPSFLIVSAALSLAGAIHSNPKKLSFSGVFFAEF